MSIWTQAAARGVYLYLAPDGTVRIKPGSLSLADLHDLRGRRATLVAEWLWTFPDPPSPCQWDVTVAEEILRYAVRLMSGPALSPLLEWDDVADAEQAVGHAWADEDLPQLLRAAHRWVAVVCGLDIRRKPRGDRDGL
ncbi:hypothetical protein [Sulfobacillus thermosulfidooxidans]|uniref:hypothetical protein n=1 Tax=Sulfobacillus thermosulfidooxidans TaxID=28034 RepID=UPI0002FAE66A|nr:hypothetical protein [Sulfobacillus thermosulfidooxidans]